MPTLTAPIQRLVAEHRVIEQVLDCLTALAVEGARRGALDLLAAREVLEVLSGYADRLHHGKEELLLFSTLERRGFPRHVGPLAVIVGEHEAGRAALLAMRRELDLFAHDPAHASERFHDHARGYVELLSEHIAKEDGVLFPMAESLLRDEDRSELAESFERFDATELGHEGRERLVALADSLAERFEVSKARERRAPVGVGCCGRHGRCHG